MCCLVPFSHSRVSACAAPFRLSRSFIAFRPVPTSSSVLQVHRAVPFPAQKTLGAKEWHASRLYLHRQVRSASTSSKPGLLGLTRARAFVGLSESSMYRSLVGTFVESTQIDFQSNNVWFVWYRFLSFWYVYHFRLVSKGIWNVLKEATFMWNKVNHVF